MPKSIFYFAKLRAWDIVTIVLYLGVSVAVFYQFRNAGSPKRGGMLLAYPFITHLFLYCLNYKSLRNMTVYCIWLVIGIVHFVAYLYLRDYAVHYGFTGHSAKGLRDTIILLLLFQVLRFISARTQGQELVFPHRARTDIFNERKPTFIDFILFVVYFFSMIYLPLLF